MSTMCHNVFIIYHFLNRNTMFKRTYAGIFDVSSGMFSNVILLSHSLFFQG